MHMHKGRTGEELCILDGGMLPVGINNTTTAFISSVVSEMAWLFYVNDV